MNLVTLRDLVAARISTLWITTNADIAWPDRPFTPTKGNSYIRPRLEPGLSEVASLGIGGANQQIGRLVIDLFVPKGTGERARFERLDLLKALFNRQNLSGVQFGAAETVTVGAEPDTPWHHSQVVFNWDYYENP